jgi:hypothetical protein
MPAAARVPVPVASGARPAILLSFDAEEFDVPVELGQGMAMDQQMAVGREGMVRTLDLLDALGTELGTPVISTFFCTATFAQHCPELILRAAAAGHEIASHGWRHTGWDNADLLASRLELERITGRPVAGFRRSRLAETDRGAIAAAGYRYNSSENPTWLPGRYNRMFKPRLPYRTGELLNIPASATPVVRFPLFWLSLKAFPLWVNRLATRAVLWRDPAVVLYFHPWELCEMDGFRVPGPVRRCCGKQMIDRLATHIRWLAGQGRFTTYAEFAASAG